MVLVGWLMARRFFSKTRRRERRERTGVSPSTHRVNDLVRTCGQTGIKESVHGGLNYLSVLGIREINGGCLVSLPRVLTIPYHTAVRSFHPSFVRLSAVSFGRKRERKRRERVSTQHKHVLLVDASLLYCFVSWVGNRSSPHSFTHLVINLQGDRILCDKT